MLAVQNGLLPLDSHSFPARTLQIDPFVHDNVPCGSRATHRLWKSFAAFAGLLRKHRCSKRSLTGDDRRVIAEIVLRFGFALVPFMRNGVDAVSGEFVKTFLALLVSDLGSF